MRKRNGLLQRIKQGIASVVCVCILTSSIPVSASSGAEQTFQLDEKYINVLGTPTANVRTAQDMVLQYKFTARQGHGFAAERGNNLVDSIKGKNAFVVGDNNVKNGADRLIISHGNEIWIQTKYCATASQTVSACFDETGVFRYFDSNHTPMQIEVPSDQYKEAVELMAKKIQEGKVPGVTDPDDAKLLVREGSLSYKQAKNVAKAGNIDSLKYDATNGVVSAACAFGISTLLNYAVSRFNGVSREDAIKSSALSGLKTGLLAFGASVISGQLAKTGLKNAFKPSSEALMKALGKDFAKKLIEISGEQVVREAEETTTQAITRTAARAFRANVIANIVTLVVFSTPDAIDLFQGRISKKQFVKNFAVIAISVAAGSAGYFAGAALSQLVVPGVGTIPGGILGSVLVGGAAGIGADLIADYITDDDADEMYGYLQEQFTQCCIDFIVDEEEANNVISALGNKLNDDVFKDMYQSEDRLKFAEDFLVPLFEEEIAKREVIQAPTEEELRAALLEELQGVVFIH